MKPRGVAGTVLLYKILGAASYLDKKLDYIADMGEDILKNMYSFGVSFDSCSLPGQPKSHQLESNEIEIGMGIHGEPGKTKTAWMKNHDLCATLLAQLKEQYGSGDIVVMVNSLGNVTGLELTLIVNDVTKILKQ